MHRACHQKRRALWHNLLQNAARRARASDQDVDRIEQLLEPEKQPQGEERRTLIALSRPHRRPVPLPERRPSSPTKELVRAGMAGMHASAAILACALLLAAACGTAKHRDAPVRDQQALEAQRTHTDGQRKLSAPTASSAQPAKLEGIVLSIERSHDEVALVVQNHGASNVRLQREATLARMPAAVAAPAPAASEALAGFRLDACEEASDACIELAPGGELRAAELRLREPVRCGCAPCARPVSGEHAFVVQTCGADARAQSETLALSGR